MSFPFGSAGKESACNAGDLDSILGWEGTLEKGKATHFSMLGWRIPRTVHGVAKSWTWLSDFHSLHLTFYNVVWASSNQLNALIKKDWYKPRKKEFFLRLQHRSLA